jgi:chromate transporter
LTKGAGLLGEIGWFYAWLAVVSFGGAYALLGYMTQTLVQDYGWITTPQMIDALGLAETTPGPLILVTQFVAMLAGYGTGGAALAIAAGFVALWATFVPCFLWIFTAAPYLDAITARPRLQSALGAITAAVLGVILSLSVWFAFNVLFATVGTWSSGPLSVPWPTFSSLDVKALALVAVAAALLLWRKMGLGLVLPTMAALGTALGLL